MYCLAVRSIGCRRANGSSLLHSAQKEHSGYLAQTTQYVSSAPGILPMAWLHSAPSSLGICFILTLLPFLIFPWTPLLFSYSNQFPYHHQEWMISGETMYLRERATWKMELQSEFKYWKGYEWSSVVEFLPRMLKGIKCWPHSLEL